jgi:hypothetical protein
LNALRQHQELLQQSWQPNDYVQWASIGARLMNSLGEIQKLLIAAENLVLIDQGKLAGFNLSMIFTMLKGLTNERAMLAYIVANPEIGKDAKTWDIAVEKVKDL